MARGSIVIRIDTGHAPLETEPNQESAANARDSAEPAILALLPRSPPTAAPPQPGLEGRLRPVLEEIARGTDIVNANLVEAVDLLVDMDQWPIAVRLVVDAGRYGEGEIATATQVTVSTVRRWYNQEAAPLPGQLHLYARRLSDLLRRKRTFDLETARSPDTQHAATFE